jgi:hypothetical protein
MGGNQNQQQQSVNPYQGGSGQDFDPAAFSSQIKTPPEESGYFNVLMDDLYQRMKARAASDTAGYSYPQGDTGEGFQF